MYKCKYCGKEYCKKGIGTHIWRNHGAGKNFDPNQSYKNGTKIVWNKGKTKLDDKRIAIGSINSTQSHLRNLSLGITKGHRLSEEHKARLKEIAFDKIRKGEWHNSFSHARTYLYKSDFAGDVKLYGTWELLFAQYLDLNDIKWERPKNTFEYVYEGNIHHYTPDFYLLDDDLYIEIKGYKTARDIAKWNDFSKQLLVLEGKHLFEMGLISSYRNCGLPIKVTGRVC